MKKLSRFLVVWAGLVLSIPGYGQTIADAVNNAAAAYLKDTARVGLSIGVISGGKQYNSNYGETSPGSGLKPTGQSIYEIGSISKTFTALMLAHAIMDKKISLNDDIRKYLDGSYPNLQYADGSPVKVVYLIAHIARFPNNFDDTHDGIAFRQELYKMKLDTLKPFRYAYSNAGYQLLGYILENAYHKSYEDLLKQLITGPLGMRDTKVMFSKTDSPLMLYGYNAKKQRAPNMQAAFPGAGAIRSTMHDMMIYMDYEMKEPDVYVKMTHRALFGNVDNNANTIPWTIGRNRDWDFFMREDGGTRGYRTFLTLFPDYQTGIMLLTNQTDESAGQALYDLTNTIFKAIKTADY
jgi:D-alanyl-D-alanine-carboxypeptidase/D-alanyl-D-alanine-endopeptidase